MKLLLSFFLFVILCQARAQNPFEPLTKEYSGSELTPTVIKRHTSRYHLPAEAHVLHIYDSEGMTGGEITVQFELPARLLPAFLEAGPFKSAKLGSVSIAVSAINGSSWFSPEQRRDLEKRAAFLSGSASEGKFHYAILVDTSHPDVFVIYVQDAE